ncbi:MAG: alkaline phosphatase family protein [Phycisphaerae bacterium]
MFALFVLCGPAGCKKKSAAEGKKVLVLGCDGMDPRLVRRMIAEGRLPHFATLARQGGFKPLETSIPPQSPVAWSNFITGAGPGVHGIFDFIHRDPSQQASPYFSTNRVESEEEDPWLEWGDYRVPDISSQNNLLRRGKPFWEFLDEKGVPVRMYRLPANYPPSKSAHGHVCCLPGMGVPDALGNQGTFQHFTTKLRRESRGAEGMKLRIRRDFKTGGYFARLLGPPNVYKKPLPDADGPPEMTMRLNIYPDPDRDVAKIVYVNEDVAGGETVELVLNAGEWSGWKEVRFYQSPLAGTFDTMVRFCLQQVHPEIRLYVSPLNFIPTAPAAPISEPEDFIQKIGKAIGPFYTQGFAEEFNGLKDGTLTDEEYRAQAWYVLEERFKMLDYALDRFEDGLLFFYFSSTDLQAHMFWWDSQEKHPVRVPEAARKYMAVVEDVYVKMDEALGRCMDKLGEDATIIVMSDHGFCNFRRGVSLNTWLRDEGYLVTLDHPTHPGYMFNTEKEWRKTRAYGLGLNGLYLNLKGREKYGVVTEAERGPLLDEITEKLLALRDPQNGRQVIKRVYRTERCYSGQEAKHAPDLIIGYARDYRASWQTCLGDFDDAWVIDNDNPWSADHCIAHDEVPGIVLSNRKIRSDAPALIDVAPTILATFGVDRPAYMTGRSLFETSSEAKLARR